MSCISEIKMDSLYIVHEDKKCILFNHILYKTHSDLLREIWSCLDICSPAPQPPSPPPLDPLPLISSRTFLYPCPNVPNPPTSTHLHPDHPQQVNLMFYINLKHLQLVLQIIHDRWTPAGQITLQFI